MPNSPELTVVVPCFNEQEVLRETHNRITAVVRASAQSYELVYVNDGSRDNTMALLAEIHAADPHVRVVNLSRNFGHQLAVSAGLDYAHGEAIVILDADLQDPPEVIAVMLQRWREGYDVVYGIRHSREGESRLKLWTAKAFYRLINSVADTEIPLDSGDFRLLSRRAAAAMLSMRETHRLLRGMSSWIGFRQCGIPYERAARFAGTTKYPLRRMLNLAIDGVLSFSTVPLRLVSMVGLLAATLACVGILYAFALRLFTRVWVPGWALLFIGVLFLGGLQMLSLGVVGEYIGRIYTEVKRRPLYLVQEVYEHAAVPDESKVMKANV